MRTRQGALFTDIGSLRTQVISSRKDFDALFDGFTRMRAISYVVSPDILLEFFEKGFTQIEVVVGDNLVGRKLSDQYRQGLAEKDQQVTEFLLERVESNALQIWVPERTIHTKFYLLEGTDSTRAIQTSANLTETARRASQQINYAWYADLPVGDPLLEQAIGDYEWHLKDCSLFMGNLSELLHNRQDVPRHELIETWLGGESADEVGLETRRAFQQITDHSLELTGPQEEQILSFHLPEVPQARRPIEKYIKPLKPSMNGNEVRLNLADFLTYVHKNLGVPLMHIDTERSEVRLGINGSVNILTEPLPDKQILGEALEHIETYLETVAWGQTRNPLFVKRCVSEALLYIFSAPFSHEHMKIRRRLSGAIESRGPRFLYIYGDSQNGKTTFLRFALKLLTGQLENPLPGAQFSTKKLPPALTTVFPLLFDDVASSKNRTLETVFKNYWEVWWTPEFALPQIILTSNAHNLPEWAKSRSKQVHFDIHFPQSENNIRMLSHLITRENHIFKWFSYLYLSHLTNYEPHSEDQLELARIVMQEMYYHAERKVPESFPQSPIEDLYDMDRQTWLDLLHGLKKAEARRDKSRVLIDFSDDMTIREVKEYQGLLPQSVKSKTQGKTLIIESPGEFWTWLEDQPRSGVFARIKDIFRS